LTDWRFPPNREGKTSSPKAAREVQALKRLKKEKCKFAPKFVGCMARKATAKGYGTEHIIVMTKVPGTALQECVDFYSIIRRDEFRSAFNAATW
jgi:hypothetical protein